MLASGPILDQLFEDLDATTPEKQRSVVRRLNLSYFDMARMQSWEALRRTTTLSFTGDAAGVLLPSSLCGIDALYDADNNIIFQPRTAWNIPVASDVNYRYAITSTSSAPVNSGTCTINKRSNIITGITAGYTGEYISFEGRFGIYKIASDTTLALTFLEDGVNSGNYAIRPTGTKRLAAYDGDGDLMTGTATLDWWELPQPVTDPAVPIVFPTSDALMLHTYMRHIGLKNMDENKAERYRREFAEAYERCSSLNPIYVTPNAPANANNGTINLYGSLQP